MRIILISDTHGSYRALETVIKNNLDADMFFHLGDGDEELELLRIEYPEIVDRLHTVRGNCDDDFSVPCDEVVELPYGHKAFLTHGHEYAVGATYNMLLRRAKAEGCDIAIHGHTHCSFYCTIDGVLIMNPGSAARPRDEKPASYGWLDITPDGVIGNIVPVDRR